MTKIKVVAAALIVAVLISLVGCAPVAGPDPKYTLVIEQTDEYTSLQLVERGD